MKINKKLMFFLIFFIILLTFNIVCATNNSEATELKSTVEKNTHDSTAMDNNNNEINDENVKTIIKNTQTQDEKSSNTNKKVTLNISTQKTAPKTYYLTATIENNNPKGYVEFYADNTYVGDGFVKDNRAQVKYKFKNYRNYSIQATYVPGQNEYYMSPVNSLEVKKTNITINTKDYRKIDITKNVVLKLNISDNNSPTEANISLYHKNELMMTKNVVNNCVNFNLGKYEEGNYTFTAVYTNKYKESAKKTINVEMHRKVEKVTIISPDTFYSENTMPITVKASNDTVKLQNGLVKLFYDNNEIFHENIENGSVTFDYLLPRKPGNHILTAYYVNEDKTLANTSKNINVIPFEKLEFEPADTIPMISNYTFIARVTKNNTNVNYGRVVIKINDETVVNSPVNNGLVSVTCATPFRTTKWNVTASYVNFDETLIHINKTIAITYSTDNIIKYVSSLGSTPPETTTLFTSSPYITTRGRGYMGQINGHACGPHSLMQNLYKLGIRNYSESALYSLSNTNGYGTKHQGLDNAIKNVAEATKINVSNYWVNFSNLGSNTNERFKKLGQLISKPNVGCIVHDLYRNRYGHYEVIQSINTKTRTATVLNSLGGRSGSGYVGFIENRNFDTFASYISKTREGQYSICLIVRT